MTTEAQVRQAKSAQEALLVLAQALDRIEEKGLSDVDRQPHSTWGEWDNPSASPSSASATQSSKSTIEVTDDDLDDLDPHERAQVLAARRRLVADERRHIEQKDRGDDATVTVSQGHISVELPVADEKRKAKRRTFAKQVLNLPDHFPNVEDAIETYAKGGPLWLYLTKEGRDFILGIRPEYRKVMVQDIQVDSSGRAQEFARDVLKDRASGLDDGPSLDDALRVLNG